MEANQPIRVLVVDDDQKICDAYRSMFARSPEVELVGEIHDGLHAAATYKRVNPDIVLMDIQMPVVSGIDATREIVSQWPEAVVVATTVFGNRELVVAMLRAGASGYLLKDVSLEQLVGFLKQALSGEMPLSSGVRRELVASVVDEGATASTHDLAPREVELVQWLAHGLSNAQIAKRMYISEGSVKKYIARIGAKLGTVSRTQVLVRSIQLGIVDPRSLPPITG
ncbi:MAG: response regulator transcription factor [Ancrocorticia sp.]